MSGRWAELAAALSLTICTTLAVLAAFTRPELYALVLFMVIAVCWVLMWWATYRALWPKRVPRPRKPERELIADQLEEHAQALAELMPVLRDVDAEANIMLGRQLTHSFLLLHTLVKGVIQ